MSAITQLENELCLKFFQANSEFPESNKTRILFITNPEKLKDCLPQTYNYDNRVVEMAIGYRCLDEKSVAKTIVDMLKASIPDEEQAETNVVGSQASPGNAKSLIPPSDRYLINAKYETECRLFHQPLNPRRADGLELDPRSEKINREYYSRLLWPLGVVMYSVEADLMSTNAYQMVKYAMTEIQRGSCVAFQELFDTDGVIDAKNFISFGYKGLVHPPLGNRGRIEINLLNFTRGDPGHAAHVINNIMRLLGVYMMSNRYDRANHVNINLLRIPFDKRQFVEEAPFEAFINTSYCFASATHAPINYMCSSCELGEQSVSPSQEMLWHKSMRMGKVAALSTVDREILSLMYGSECYNRKQLL